MTAIATQPTTFSLEKRSEILASAVSNSTRHGWRVQSQTQTQAQLLKGKPTNHLLHLILTLITLGVWAIVWVLVAIFGGQKQRLVTVDEYGHVQTT